MWPGSPVSARGPGLGISAASASEHATVLRKAGLVASERHANSVLHRLTSVGEQLLGG